MVYEVNQQLQCDISKLKSQNSSQYLHFLAGELSTLARLSALSNLDLQLICVSQVVSSHAEPAGGNLLDG